MIKQAFASIGKNLTRSFVFGLLLFAVIHVAVIYVVIYNSASPAIHSASSDILRTVYTAPIGRGHDAGHTSLDITFRMGRFYHTRPNPVTTFPRELLEFFGQSRFVEETIFFEVNGGVDAAFILYDPNYHGDFEIDVHNRGLPYDYKTWTNLSLFGSIVTPIELLRDMAAIRMIIMLVLCVVVVALFALFSKQDLVGKLIILCISTAVGAATGAVFAQFASELHLYGLTQRSWMIINSRPGFDSVMHVFLMLVVFAVITGFISLLTSGKTRTS